MTKSELDAHIADIRRQRQEAQEDLNKYQAKVKKLSLIEKVLSAATGAVQSGKTESVLRYFAQDN